MNYHWVNVTTRKSNFPSAITHVQAKIARSWAKALEIRAIEINGSTTTRCRTLITRRRFIIIHLLCKRLNPSAHTRNRALTTRNRLVEMFMFHDHSFSSSTNRYRAVTIRNRAPNPPVRLGTGENVWNIPVVYLLDTAPNLHTYINGIMVCRLKVDFMLFLFYIREALYMVPGRVLK